MTQHLVESRVTWLNRFPSKSGISTTLSPTSIVLGHPKPDMQRKRIPFGAYAMVYTSTSNDMKARSVPAIALSESNDIGGFYFMSLYTGKKIHGYDWHELPIDDEVIHRVEELAEREKQPKLINQAPLFEWSPGIIIEDDNDDNDGDSVNSDDDSNDLEPEQHDNIVTDEDDDSLNDSDLSIDDESDDDIINHEHDEPQQHVDEPVIVEDVTDEEEHDEVRSATENFDDTASSTDSPPPRNDGRARRANAGAGINSFEPSFDGKSYDLRRKQQYFQYQRKKKNVQLAHVTKLMNKVREDTNAPSYLQRAVNVIFTQLEEEEKKYEQMSAKRGIKMFGEKAVAAMIKEFTQLSEGVMPGKPVVEPIDPNTLTNEDFRQAMEAVNLIKMKRSGKVKGRSCINGSKQWMFLEENEVIASPTLQLESLFLSLMIDVMEGRDVAIFDVPGAYLHAEMPKDKRVLMKFRGEFVDIMCKVNPEHKKNVIYEKGKKVLYVRVLRAIYGAIQSALLWYELYATTLMNMGFEINPYDKCVANKMINGKQCTMSWYVDDNKLSHDDSRVVDDILNTISKKFGDLTIT